MPALNLLSYWGSSVLSSNNKFCETCIFQPCCSQNSQNSIELTLLHSTKLTLLHSEWSKLHRVLTFLSAIGLNSNKYFFKECCPYLKFCCSCYENHLPASKILSYCSKSQSRKRAQLIQPMHVHVCELCIYVLQTLFL